jgi:integrase
MNSTMKSEFYRVLKPQEVKSIIDVIPKMRHKMAFKTELYTGMRFKELHDFSGHADWFNHKRKLIILPAKYTKTHEERKVNLTPQFSEILYYYLEAGNELKYPSYQTWQMDLCRWSSLAGIEDAINISAGTLRKTWESWLLESGYVEIRVMASQGHSSATSFKHYYNNDWSLEEREQIKKETSGWM